MRFNHQNSSADKFCALCLTAFSERLSRSISITQIFFIFFAIGFPYQYAIRYLNLFDSVSLSLFDAIMFTTIAWMTTRLDLARVTLCFLALPYLIFIPGWLNHSVAAVILIVFLYCITNTLRAVSATTNAEITGRDLFAFILIIIWVNLSGAGGYGYQTPDYIIHNARLKDLIDYPWPVHYGENQNFVSYFGYFLPASIIGKLSNLDIGFRSMFPWTLLGITLVLRWLSFLSHWRFSALLVLVFIFFGPIDILNVLMLGFHANIPLASSFGEMAVNSDYLDFRTRYDIGFIIGNYLSNTFQFFWSPHQVIAGWLCAGMMTHLFLQKKMGQFIFIYTLLCLWSPLIMIALFPFVFFTSAKLFFIDKKWREIVTIENTLGAGAITIVFIVFYLGGSPQSIPSPFMFSELNWGEKGWILVLFYLSAWAIYILLLTPFIIRQHSEYKWWFVFLISALLMLSLKKFGAYSDLLCRGSAPLMFLLLVFILQAIRQYQQQKRYLLITLLCLMTLGSGSSLLQLRTAIHHRDIKPETGSITRYSYAEENLGPDNTIFNRYFRRGLEAQKSQK